MLKRKLKRQILKKRLFNKNRLVILNEDTFEEIFSLKLNLMNVFVVLTISSILLVGITTYIIAFTPLREYIPGYASTALKKEAMDMSIKTDSLAIVLDQNQYYLESLRKVLTGDVAYANFNKDSIIAAQMEDASRVNFSPIKADSLLRIEVAQEDKYNLFEQARYKINVVLFPPAKGIITDKYNPRAKHFAVDIALANNTPIKAVANGTVIFADWTPSTGNVMIIKHNDGILSVYKHATTLTKSQHDVVRTGEVIALAGSTGTESTGVHLHFELWKEGYPVDPTQFIDFE